MITAKEEFVSVCGGLLINPIKVTIRRSVNKYGWIIWDGLHTFTSGWFKSESSRDTFAIELHREFFEVSRWTIAPLLVMCANSKVNSIEYNFAIGHLEKLLDKQETMDVGKAYKIHRFVEFVMEGSLTRKYNIHDRLMNARETLK